MKLIQKVKQKISLRRYLLLSLLILPWMLFQSQAAFGQNGTKTVTGKVTDNTDFPLPGVTVFVKGTTMGTTTNPDGVYTLDGISENSTIVFSFVGMETQEVLVGNQVTIDVVLSSESFEMDEIVAVGYGTQKKKDLTGSIVRVEMEGKGNAANVDIAQALQGYTPGLNATGGTKAGETGSLSIRGRTSLSANQDPLIVLDGIIFNGSLTDINVNDIQSIDVLKDASAAAVYGSRSANGVIVITSKRGKSEKPQFNFNAYYGVQDLANTKRTNVMNGDQYAVRLVDYHYQQDLHSWYKTGPTSADARPVRPDVTDRELVAGYLRTAEEQANYLAGNEIDWIDEVFRVAPMQSYNLSVAGQSERSNYYISTSYMEQEGIIENDKFSRFTFFTKLETEITDWLTFEFNPSYTRRDYSGLEASTRYALEASPLGNKYDDLGNYPLYIAEESMVHHPLGNLLVDDSRPRDNLNLVGKARIDIPWIDGLKFETNYQQSYTFSRNARFYNSGTTEGSKVRGLAERSNTDVSKWLLNNILTYDKVINKDNRLNVTLLQSAESLYGEGMAAEAYGFDNETLGYHGMHLAETQTISTSAYQENTLSLMGRVNYTYKDRYLLTGTIRRDGFCGFGANRKYANFPSLSMGWIASEESFLKDVKPIDFMKVRVSYGVNGNQGIGRYASQTRMNSTATVFDGMTAIGFWSAKLGNEDLGWEKTASLNLGLDFKLLDNRISGTVDIFKAQSSDVLVERTIPSISGNSSVWTNIGGIQNKGLEWSITTENIRTRDFSWATTVNFSMVRNKITELYDDVTEDTGNGWFVGHSINSIFGYQWTGEVWQEEDLFNGTIMNGFLPGDLKVADTNEDGRITADDRTIIGSHDPNFRMSMNNVFTYKNFSFSFFLNSIQGGNGYYMGSNNDSWIAGGTDYAYRRNRTANHAYWRPDNPVNNAPGMYYNPQVNPGIYQDKSFIRLQDVTFGYTFDRKVLEKLKVNNLKVYVSGKNLYTWSKYTGWDPETNSPMIRSVIGGVNLSF